MQYFEEMFDNKFGFSDGNAIPPDAEQAREVYIRAINCLAKRLGSSQRMVAFDRFGMHNTYLILLYPKPQLDEAGVAPDTYHRHTDIPPDPLGESQADAAMQQATREASMLDLDSYVLLEVTIADDFDSFLSELQSGGEIQKGENT